MELYAPDVPEFFYFADMAENYPFTGTGNLFRFRQGLASIGILNKVLVVFDNDSAGRENYETAASLDLPVSMHITKLPEMADFNIEGLLVGRA